MTLRRRPSEALRRRSSEALRRWSSAAPRRRSSAALIVLIVLIVSALASTGCVVVPQNRRARLADPMMSLNDDALEAYRKQKLYNTREGAAGGDGAAAGGGCGCQ